MLTGNFGRMDWAPLLLAFPLYSDPVFSQPKITNILMTNFSHSQLFLRVAKPQRPIFKRNDENKDNNQTANGMSLHILLYTSQFKKHNNTMILRKKLFKKLGTFSCGAFLRTGFNHTSECTFLA